MSSAALAFAVVKGKKREVALGTAANTLLALGLPCWEVRPAAPLLSRQDLMRRFVFSGVELDDSTAENQGMERL